VITSKEYESEDRDDYTLLIAKPNPLFNVSLISGIVLSVDM
jgi:hypothetical protein